MRRDLLPQVRDLFRSGAPQVELALAVVFTIAWFVLLIVLITHQTL